MPLRESTAFSNPCAPTEEYQNAAGGLELSLGFASQVRRPGCSHAGCGDRAGECQPRYSDSQGARHGTTLASTTRPGAAPVANQSVPPGRGGDEYEAVALW